MRRRLQRVLAVKAAKLRLGGGVSFPDFLAGLACGAKRPVPALTKQERDRAAFAVRWLVTGLSMRASAADPAERALLQNEIRELNKLHSDLKTGEHGARGFWSWASQLHEPAEAVA